MSSIISYRKENGKVKIILIINTTKTAIFSLVNETFLFFICTTIINNTFIYTNNGFK